MSDDQNTKDRLDKLEANAPEGSPLSGDPTSIDGAREAFQDASGYTALVAEVEAVEARVSGDTPWDVRERVETLRRKVEQPRLKDPRNNSIGSPVVARENVDRIRAAAQALADEV
jgi:hypothetical protein